MPCPVPARAYADDGTPIQRPRRRRKVDSDNGEQQESGEAVASETVRNARECPVPKPGGLVGQILGVRKLEREDHKPVVRVERFEARGRRIGGMKEGDGEG